jgi:hypothetical protein
MYQYGDLHTTLITEILLIFCSQKKKKHFSANYQVIHLLKHRYNILGQILLINIKIYLFLMVQYLSKV